MPARELRMETVIVIGVCCVPIAVGVFGFVAWGGRDEKQAEIPDIRKPFEANLTLAQRLRLRRRSGRPAGLP